METENEPMSEEVKVEAEETPPAEKPEVSEEDLAKAALEATEEPETKPEELAGMEGEKSKLIGEITALRGVRRDLTTQISQVPPPPPPPEKSPIELTAEQLGCTVDEVPMDGKLYRAQEAFKEKQVAIAAERTRVAQYDQSVGQARATMTDAECGSGLGLDSLWPLGAHLLTQGDAVDLRDKGPNAGAELYDRLTYRILKAGGQNAKILRQRLATHKSQAKPATKAKDKDKPEKEPEKEPEPPSQQEVLDATGAQIGATFDL